MNGTALARALFLGASRNRFLNAFMAARGLKLGAARFVAGETLDEFIPIARALNANGFSVAAAILGEGVSDATETSRVAAAYCELLARLAREGLAANAALKLTHLGLGVDEGLALQNLDAVVDCAAAHGNFVRIDMEESAFVDATLRIYRTLRAGGKSNLGVVLQSYLYRTPADLEALLPLHPNLRLVKGAYLEAPTVAHPRKADVDRAYEFLIESALQGAGYTAIATHDEGAIRHAIAFAASRGIAAKGRFEFQMLYGVRPALQRSLLAEGYPVRVAAPFGRAWYPYFMRRLAERPANAAFILRSLWKG